tara:strand:- start:5 stop:538 length:534 start_codon:yes stop_codon:yes gene_type:complete
MIRFCIFTIIVNFCLIFSVGCKQSTAPNPDDTKLGGNLSSRPDWVNETGIPGLHKRDVGEQGNYVEGILPSIHFDFDQTFIRQNERYKLDEAAEYLRSNPENRLLLEGHCDWRGTAEYNLSLGDRRANSVEHYLSNLGISPSRIETVSMGDLEAVTEGSESHMQEDRRADLIVIKPL